MVTFTNTKAEEEDGNFVTMYTNKWAGTLYKFVIFILVLLKWKNRWAQRAGSPGSPYVGILIYVPGRDLHFLCDIGTFSLSLSFLCAWWASQPSVAASCLISSLHIPKQDSQGGTQPRRDKTPYPTSTRAQGPTSWACSVPVSALPCNQDRKLYLDRAAPLSGCRELPGETDLSLAHRYIKLLSTHHPQFWSPVWG